MPRPDGIDVHAHFFSESFLTHSPGGRRFLIETVGPDRVMLGGDFGFDMGYEPPCRIAERLGLRPADHTRILPGNEKLLRVT